jgi:hypothetical protein
MAQTDPPAQVLQRHGVDPSNWNGANLEAWRADLCELSANSVDLEHPRRRPAV